MTTCRQILLLKHLTPRTMSSPIKLPSTQQQTPKPRTTRLLPIDPSKIGKFVFSSARQSFLDEDWSIQFSPTTPDAAHLLEAAAQVRTGNTPVAFPTETVYGLGADATRSSAVLGIYAAKQRPADNPLIIHISSLSQLRKLLRPNYNKNINNNNNRTNHTHDDTNSLFASPPSDDPIPPIYHALITRFWPGPLTVLLPLPDPSPLAPQVTCHLPTFAARMPSSLLALALIHAAGTPLAAPSANASTKPSPTTAAHVYHDLCGKIDIILDGGACDIGVESTVVDGLCSPPVVLRPGGVSIDALRTCPGWEDVRIGYRDYAEMNDGGGDNGGGAVMVSPRAPGMKYKHYSPRARVVLVRKGVKKGDVDRFVATITKGASVGVIGTRKRITDEGRGLSFLLSSLFGDEEGASNRQKDEIARTNGDDGYHSNLQHSRIPILHSHLLPPSSSSSPPSSSSPSPSSSSSFYSTSISNGESDPSTTITPTTITTRTITSTGQKIYSINIGPSLASIAHGLFSALRELDLLGVEVILVESLDDSGGGKKEVEKEEGEEGEEDEGGEGGQGGQGAAIMNRLRKAAEFELR